MKTWIWVALAVIVTGGGAYWWMQQTPAPQIQANYPDTSTTQQTQQQSNTFVTPNSVKFNATAGATFTLAVGQSANDGAGGITVKLDSITRGQYPYANVMVVSASSTFEANITSLQKMWNAQPDMYAGSAGSYLAWSAKFGDNAWPDTNSSSGTVILQVVSVDTASQNVTFKVRTEPFPPVVNSG